MSDTTADAPLPCGTRPEDLLEQVAEGHGDRRDEHQRQCQHCSGRLDRYQQVWHHLERLRARPVPLPPGFVDRVMARVGREVAGTVRLRDAGPGRSTVRVGVLELVAGLAAQQVDGVIEVRSALFTADAGLARLEVVVRFGLPLEDVAAAVRDIVLVHARSIVGTVLTGVDVVVVDVSGG